jgi:hypothetical protein
VESKYVEEHATLSVALSDTIARQLHESNGGVLPLDRLQRALKTDWLQEQHPGCQLSGFLLVDRVPGKFHIQARSIGTEFNPAMTNVSHEVHHLSFGEPYNNQKIDLSPKKKDVAKNIAPMDNNVYVTRNAHEAHHHYIKIIPTRVMYDNRVGGKNPMGGTAISHITVYQVLEQSQLTFVNADVSPEAQFQFDFSPIAVAYVSKTRKWYDYLTSVMAIIGGTFTLVGMIESSLQVMVSGNKRMAR